MRHFSQLLDACDATGHLARQLGVALLDAEDTQLDGRTVQVQGRSVLNFCSCSALGLELDPRLIEGAIDATRRYGTQFSMSRTFVSAPPYAELEALLEELTGGPTLVLPSTTLASAAALPTLIGPDDAVLLDQQVHMSVQIQMPLLESIGVRVVRVPHADTAALDERLESLAGEHERLWHLTDGVHSMHGDLARLDDLQWLLERHPSLHLYVDDAHGTSWTGRRGRGHALDGLPRRDRVVVALSLNKSFGAGGAALVFPDEKLRQRVRHTSLPTNFGGPVQPPMLGAALASARIHLTPELDAMQAEIRRLIEHVNHRCESLALPLLHRDMVVPIRFIGLGPDRVSTEMATHLLEHGLLASCALFPAVPPHQTGIRFTLTRHHETEDVDRLLETIADFLPQALQRAGIDRKALDEAFDQKTAATPIR